MARQRTGGGDPLAERIKQLNAEIDRLREQNQALRKKRGTSVSAPTGTLDKTGVKHATGGGIACAPVGAYSQEIVDWIYSMIDASASYAAKGFWHLGIVEDGIGAVVGFVVGWGCVALYKTLKPYKSAG